MTEIRTGDIICLEFVMAQIAPLCISSLGMCTHMLGLFLCASHFAVIVDSVVTEIINDDGK